MASKARRPSSALSSRLSCSDDVSASEPLGGAILTESVFNIPGVGRLVVDAISRRDYPIIQGVMIIFAAVYVLINLVIDILYSFIDPRIRYS